MVLPVFVAIAVARPDGLEEVRGAIPSATRLAQWADSQGYAVKLVTDESEPVTCARLAGVFKDMLGAGGQPRIVVSFAGHGLIRGGAEEFWLLSRWRTQPTEAVNYLKLRDRLGTYLPKQVAIVSDACRSLPTERAKWVEGNGVVEIKDYVEKPVQIASLNATRAAQPAYATPLDAAESYCFFSQVLLDALCDKSKAVAEQGSDGRFVVTQDRLFEVVECELPQLAGRHGRRQIPDLQAGWRKPADVVWSTVTDEVRALAGPLLAPAEDGAQALTRPAGLESADARVSDFMGRLANEARATHFETDCGLVIIGAEVEEVVAAPGVVVERDDGGPAWFRLDLKQRTSASVAVRLGNGAWIAAASYPGRIGAFTIEGEGADSFLLRRTYTDRAPAEGAVALAATGASLSDPYEYAAVLRGGKHEDPVLGALAAYAYARVGAIDEIRRMCFYYGASRQPAPFDAVLLARVRLAREGDTYVCDIPAVPSRPPMTEVEKRFPYAFEHTPAVKLTVAGGFPWLRQGWALLEDDFRFEMRALAALAPGVRPNVFTTLNPARGRALANLIQDGAV